MLNPLNLEECVGRTIKSIKEIWNEDSVIISFTDGSFCLLKAHGEDVSGIDFEDRIQPEDIGWDVCLELGICTHQDHDYYKAQQEVRRIQQEQWKEQREREELERLTMKYKSMTGISGMVLTPKKTEE